jgi:hypothetical protein
MPFYREEMIDIRQTGDTTFALVAPVRYRGKHESFLVPAGQDTDFASVPVGITWLIPRYGRWTKAAILHDYLWRTGVVSKRDADGIFRRALRELGVPLYKRWLMWTAVRTTSILLHKGLRGTPLKDLMILVPFALLNMVLLAIPVSVVYAFIVVFKGLNWLLSLFDGKMRQEQKDMP